MSSPIFISASKMSFEFPDGTSIFQNLNFNLGPQTYGLVGPNGVGKTTLLRLLQGRLTPSSGRLFRSQHSELLPQILGQTTKPSQTIAEFLNAQEVLAALERLDTGVAKPEDIQRIGEDWNLADRIHKTLDSLGIGHLALDRPTHPMSGGEQVKLHLARLLLQRPSIVFLDEPTNNLDQEGRTALYQFVKSWTGCLVVVSHDRDLLTHVNSIVELSNQGLQFYGGNYSFYREVQLREAATLEQKITSVIQNERKQKLELQQSLERHQRKSSRGKRKAAEGGIPKIVAGGLKRKAQTSLARIQDTQESRLQQVRTDLLHLKSQIKDCNRIQVDLPETWVPQKKVLLHTEDFNFRFSGAQHDLLARPISFTLVGPKRVCLLGSNGSGKSTLLRLLMRDLSPKQAPQGTLFGQLQLKTTRVAYLDQNTEVLGSSDRSLLQIFSSHTPHLSEAERRIRLGRFQFEQETTLQTISSLSGGERIRASLACVLFSNSPPELLILDEPTNNLDMDSMEQIESALSNFKGALLIVSHDKTFLKNLGVSEEVQLEGGSK